MKNNKNTKSAIIFDFNRTLYDPDEDTLIEGTLEVLTYFSKTHVLFLVSYKEGSRQNALSRLGIRKYFRDVYFVTEKTRTLFREITMGIKGDIYVVGDHISSEIAVGNACNMKTVWFKQGKFKSNTPRTTDETPMHTITKLSELVDYIT